MTTRVTIDHERADGQHKFVTAECDGPVAADDLIDLANTLPQGAIIKEVTIKSQD